jgi:hypothetical protein
MLTIQVHLETSRARSRNGTPVQPPEWQEVAAWELLLQEQAGKYVRFRVEQGFVAFLRDREIMFEELSGLEGESNPSISGKPAHAGAHPTVE